MQAKAKKEENILWDLNPPLYQCIPKLTPYTNGPISHTQSNGTSYYIYFDLRLDSQKSTMNFYGDPYIAIIAIKLRVGYCESKDVLVRNSYSALFYVH